MKVLIVGSGGREHAMAWKVAQSPLLSQLFCSPGNPGMAECGEVVPHNDIEELLRFAQKESVDLTIVGPEAPLAQGIVDRFNGLRIFGPSKAAAELEASKSFAKAIMLENGVQTAQAEVFEDYAQAEAFIQQKGAPIVIKADGLAAGKGVTVAASTEEAIEAAKACLLSNQHGGSRIVVEDFISGQEASVIAIVDGETVKPFVVSQDYKRHGENNTGPNTGGMGAISPTPVLSDSQVGNILERVFLPTIRGLKKKGIDFRGFLYAGIMVDKSDGIYVLEFNCRLGDPETQVLMPRLESDLLEVLTAACDGELENIDLKASPKAAACVVASSKGYPSAVDDGKEIHGLPKPTDRSIVFQAGTTLQNNRLLTKGGRVLSSVGLGDTLPEALEIAYDTMEKISFEGMYYRKDIGQPVHGR